MSNIPSDVLAFFGIGTSGYEVKAKRKDPKTEGRYQDLPKYQDLEKPPKFMFELKKKLENDPTDYNEADHAKMEEFRSRLIKIRNTRRTQVKASLE